MFISPPDLCRGQVGNEFRIITPPVVLPMNLDRYFHLITPKRYSSLLGHLESLIMDRKATQGVKGKIVCAFMMPARLVTGVNILTFYDVLLLSGYLKRKDVFCREGAILVECYHRIRLT